jgi:hypothetical protein
MSLKLTYSDVYQAVAEYLGLGTSPSGSNLTKVQSLTKRGYRRFLMPIDSSNGTSYKWKFLERTTTLSTQADEDTYNLPAGFSSFVTTFTYTTPVSYNPVQKDLAWIYEHKSTNTGTGYPRYFALQSGDYDQINGQLYKVVFWPTPSGTYNYYYTYNFTPPDLTNNNDVFVGDDLASEAIMECCLAAAEFNKYDSPNTPNPNVHGAEAEKLVQFLIGKDKKDRHVPNLGQITSGKVIKYINTNTIYDQNGDQLLP